VPIRLDAVLQAVELPAGVANLTASLANVDGDAFTHFEKIFSATNLVARRGGEDPLAALDLN